MYQHVPVKTTITPNEVEPFSALQRELKATSAGLVRAMVRYCLANPDNFVNWVHAQSRYGDGSPPPKSSH